MRRGLALLCSIGLTGCAADPSVRYVEASSPAAVAAASPHLIDSFYLQKNDVHIALRNNAAAGKPPTYDLVVTDTRAEEPTHRLMVLRDDSVWTRTSINLAKVENSDLIENVGVAVEDHRMELIQTIGTAAKTILPLLLAPAAGGPPVVPKLEDRLIAECTDFPKVDCDLPQPADAGIPEAAARRGPDGSLQALWGPVPASAITRQTFIAQLGARHVHGLYYAACRTLEVRYSTEDIRADAPDTEVHYRWKGKIADPRWVEFVRFPRKGNIRMHSQCGASITSEADPTQSNVALLGAALSQAAAVKQAIDAQH